MTTLIGHEHYTIEFDDRLIAEKSFYILCDMHWFMDGENTTWHEGYMEIYNLDLLDEIQYILNESGIQDFTIFLNKTIGI